MIYGIGVDIAAVERFQRFIDEDNQQLLRRLCTERERAVCAGRKEQASCLAGRFAAKEAFLKALGSGLRDGISWQDMEVANDELGKPELFLSGKAREITEQRGIGPVFLSISHDGGNAVAMVVLEAV